tara:strand:+ start:7723 stop:7884 length:162 start_codon:yes stop_codon:yes gene_type:complete
VSDYDDGLYDVVKNSIDKQTEKIKKQKLTLKRQQVLIQEQMENLVFFKKGKKK